jgi:colanic acid/amylovoran biosynthesis glycosyltransferase
LLQPVSGPAKIGYLVPQFPGQTHIFFWREIAELERRGVDVRIFSTRPPPPGLIAHDWSAAAMDRTQYLGQVKPLAALTALPAAPFGQAPVKDIVMSLSAARQLVRACQADGIGHVHVHSCGRAALIAAIAHRLGGPTYSLTLHGPLSDYGSGQRFKWRGARFATIITEKLLAEVKVALAGNLPDRLVIQPMGVDTDALRRDAPYAPHRPGGPLRLFSCGRLNKVKGHQDLMQAVRLLLDQGQLVTLNIAGEDDDGGAGYRRVLAARISELGLGDHVHLLGAIDAEAVRQHLLAAHIFVLASWHEPLGVALMEAMSCEVPTIGTAAGGVAELISDGVDGILVPPQDPIALAAAILQLSRDPARAVALGQAGRARIISSFHAGLGAQTLIREVFG